MHDITDVHTYQPAQIEAVQILEKAGWTYRYADHGLQWVAPVVECLTDDEIDLLAFEQGGKPLPHQKFARAIESA